MASVSPSQALVESNLQAGAPHQHHNHHQQETDRSVFATSLPSSRSPHTLFCRTPPPQASELEDLDYENAAGSCECSVDYSTVFPSLAPFPRPPVLVSGWGGQLAGFPSMDKISDCDSELATLLKDVHTPPEDLHALDYGGKDIAGVGGEVNVRSPVIRCGSCGSVSASDEEEEEVDDDVSSEVDVEVAPPERTSPAPPLRFRTSPPRGVHKLNKRTISPKVFLATTSPGPYSTATRFHRHHRLIQRPHLDFEKMQGTRNTRILYSLM
jgi:hypothetical protein